jgi:uncharacterized SAM-binding protein YcdF (DUF218 family)
VRRGRLWIGLVLGLAVALTGGFLWFLEATRAGVEAPRRRTDAIVVLTGGLDRVETALDLLEAGAAPRLLVSGAATGLTPAALARVHGRDPAALAGRLTIGHAAATTAGNAAETAAWIAAEAASGRPVRTLRVVTAGYHMPRAMLELRRALPGVELVAHPVVPAILREGEVPFSRTVTLLGGEYLKFGLALAGLAAMVPAGEASRR